MTETTAVVQYEREHKEHLEIANHARELANSIKDEVSFQMAANYMLDIQAYRKAWAGKIAPSLEAAQDTKRAAERGRKAVCDLADSIDLPLKRAECEIMKPAMAVFEIKQTRIRLAEQVRVEVEQRKLQEDAKLEMAIKYEERGDKDAAEMVIDQPTVAVAVEMPKKTLVGGISFSWDYSSEVIDVKSLIKAVLAGDCSAACIIPDTSYLNKRARSDKDAFSIPGVKLIKKRSVAGNPGRRF